MPVITFASPKGGAGKTTAALLLATELAVKGFDVTVIDADPLKWIEGWSKLPDKPANLEVLVGLTEDNIIEAIDQAQSRSQFVIIDLEGTASTIVAYALSRSNFVLVPIQPSNMDARAGAMIVKLIRNHEQAFRIEIPFALFLTKTRGRDSTQNAVQHLDAARTGQYAGLSNTTLGARCVPATILLWRDTRNAEPEYHLQTR